MSMNYDIQSIIAGVVCDGNLKQSAAGKMCAEIFGALEWDYYDEREESEIVAELQADIDKMCPPKNRSTATS